MRMVDGEELFTALAHLPLGGEKLFGSNFVGDMTVGRDIPQPVNASCFAVVSSADESTALGGIGFASVREKVGKVRLLESDHASVLVW